MLPDSHGTPVSLEALRGGAVLLVFFPFAFSGTCTRELRELDAVAAELADAGVRPVGITCDSVFALRAWQEAEGVGVDLVSDFWPHGAAARAYGVLDEGPGRPVRASFLVGVDGVVRWSAVHAAGQGRDPAEHRAALAAL